MTVEDYLKALKRVNIDLLGPKIMGCAKPGIVINLTQADHILKGLDEILDTATHELIHITTPKLPEDDVKKETERLLTHPKFVTTLTRRLAVEFWDYIVEGLEVE